MKTLKQIEAEAKPLRDIIIGKSKIKDVKRARKQLAFLRQCARYLETKPTEDCLKRQLDGVKHSIKTYEERFGTWCEGKIGGLAEKKRVYNKECGMSQLKAQLKTMKYLVN